MRKKLDPGKNRRPGPWIITALCAVLSFSAAGITSAYLTDAETRVNQIRVGSNVITITEEFEPPEEGLTEEFKKKITVKNTGETDCFVRVMLALSDGRLEPLAEVSTDNRSTWMTYENLFHQPPENWIYIEEAEEGPDAFLGGFFYYRLPIKPEEMTTALTDAFRFTFETEHDKEKLAPQGYDILVYAESVQTLDKDGQEWTGSEAYYEAWKEFLERK